MIHCQNNRLKPRTCPYKYLYRNRQFMYILYSISFLNVCVIIGNKNNVNSKMITSKVFSDIAKVNFVSAAI